MNNRLFFLDNLRSFIIFLVIAMHAALPYTHIMPLRFSWYIHQQSGETLFDIIIIFLDIFIMPTMFFIAGYFALPSLLKRTPEKFLKDKFKRIILPYFLVMIFLNGYPNYINETLHYHNQLGYFSYWLKHYLPFLPVYLHTGNAIAFLWFLPTLYVFYCLLALVNTIFNNYLRLVWKQKSPSSLFLFIIMLLTGLSFCVIRQYYHDYECWKVVAFFFRIQITRLPLYLIYFFLGVYAYKRQWFDKMLSLSFLIWGIIALVGSGLYIFISLRYPMLADSQPQLNIIHAILQCVSCAAILVILLSYFQRFCYKSSPRLNLVNTNSYSIYLLHFTFIMLMGFIFYHSTLPLILLYAFSLIGSYLASLITSEYLFKRLPFIKNWLYLKPK